MVVGANQVPSSTSRNPMNDDQQVSADPTGSDDSGAVTVDADSTPAVSTPTGADTATANDPAAGDSAAGDSTAGDSVATSAATDNPAAERRTRSARAGRAKRSDVRRKSGRGGSQSSGSRRSVSSSSGASTTAAPDPLRRLRLMRASDIKGGAKFLVSGVRNLMARPLTSFHLIVSIMVILVGIGLMMVLSASAVEGYAKDGSAYGMFTTQVMFVSLGLVLFYLAMRMPVRTLQQMSLPFLLISVVLLILVMVPGLGVAGGGARRWLSFGGLTLQPSELAKAALCMWGAAVLSTRDPRTASTKEMLVPLVPVAAIVAFLVIIEPNQSTTMILGMIVMTLLWLAGLPGRYFAAFGGILVVGFIGLAFAESYRATRILSFFGGGSDPLGADYQPNQAKFALADGGLFGKGLGQSTAKWNYLPNAHNDFIFAIIGEELGLIGGLIVVGLYLLLGYVGMRIAQRSVDPFLRLMSATITVLFLVQAFINIGYVVGILPVTGIQLPILSYGGTSALTMLMMLGLLANAARHEPAAIAAMMGPQPKGLARWLRLPRPESYRGPERQAATRGGSNRSRTRRPAPVRGTVPRGRADVAPPRGRRSPGSTSSEIHYPARRTRSSRSWPQSTPSTPRDRSRRTGRSEWENGRW